MTDDDVIERLREACQQAGSQRMWADKHNISGAYVNDVLRGRRGPGDSILAALGLTRRWHYDEAAGKRRRA
jgi:hypothetical protein